MAIELFVCGSLLFERLQNVCPDCAWMNKFSLFVFGIFKLYLLKMPLAPKTVHVPMLAYSALSIQLVVS